MHRKKPGLAYSVAMFYPIFVEGDIETVQTTHTVDKRSYYRSTSETLHTSDCLYNPAPSNLMRVITNHLLEESFVALCISFLVNQLSNEKRQAL